MEVHRRRDPATSIATTPARRVCGSFEREALKDLPQGGQGIALKKYTERWWSRRRTCTIPGVRRFSFGRAEKDNQVGQVVGLAWTEVGATC